MKKLILLIVCFSLNALGASKGIQIVGKDGQEVGHYERV